MISHQFALKMFLGLVFFFKFTTDFGCFVFFTTDFDRERPYHITPEQVGNADLYKLGLNKIMTKRE